MFDDFEWHAGSACTTNHQSQSLLISLWNTKSPRSFEIMNHFQIKPFKLPERNYMFFVLQCLLLKNYRITTRFVQYHADREEHSCPGCGLNYTRLTGTISPSKHHWQRVVTGADALWRQPREAFSILRTVTTLCVMREGRLCHNTEKWWGEKGKKRGAARVKQTSRTESVDDVYHRHWLRESDWCPSKLQFVCSRV